MELQIITILSITLYKIVSLLVGLFFSYMGYRLFMSGVWGHAGELDAKLGDNKIVLKQAAPGTFFALFGTVIIAFTIVKGFDIKTKVPIVSATQTNSSISTYMSPNVQQVSAVQVSSNSELEISAAVVAPAPLYSESEIYPVEEPL